MDHFTRLKKQTANYLAILFLVAIGIVLLTAWLTLRVMNLHFAVAAIILAAETVALAIILPSLASKRLLEPVHILWQAIIHVSPGSANSPAPVLDKVGFGRELVTSLCQQVYQLASSLSKDTGSKADPKAPTILNSLPLPLLVMDKDQSIIFANEAAHKFLGITTGEMVGQNLYNRLFFSFQTNDTFDNWLAEARQNSLTSSQSWSHVRLKLPDHDKTFQLDMAAYYNKSNPVGVETVLTLFDHTKDYNREDSAVSYVALAVHELRTPLTLLRGYIEVLEEELTGKLDQELAGYLVKMEASAKQLSAFINNILNISRVEADQLVLQLSEAKWNQVVTKVAQDFKSRAASLNKNIVLNLATNLPTVAIDQVSISEVLNNLIDNALKYGGNSPIVTITSSLTEDGLVQTIVEDNGMGIAANVMPHLFEKFYRSYHTVQKASGTGLGLYLSKVIVSAHGGHIWVRSKEGKGTTIGFSLKPYDQLAGELKNNDNKAIERTAYGWINNHSLNRK